MILSSGNEKRTTRFCLAGAVIVAFVLFATPVTADAIRLGSPQPEGWPQPHSKGSSITITYSYANLLDGTFLVITPAELRAATEEALGLWASYAPLHFIERPDSGPAVSDQPYAADGHPQIRFGHHELSSEVAHAFYPGSEGLSGDVHFSADIPWTVGNGRWNYLEAVTHELGHALGLVHELDEIAVMNPTYPSHRFDGLGSAHLYPADIRQIQRIYGGGIGSVHPLNATPEPSSSLLVLTGLAALARYRRRHRQKVCAGNGGELDMATGERCRSQRFDR